MRWQDCEASVLWGADVVFITLRHLPTKIGITRRYSPELHAWMMDDIFKLLDHEVDDYLRSKT